MTIRLKMIRLIYMNETNVNPRQKFVLNLISKSNGTLRSEIQLLTGTNYKISKPTLIRDLNQLIDQKLIRIEGKGKNTKYFSYSRNPLLRPFDLEQYFLNEPDSRVDAKKDFNFSVFNHLNGLFLKEEINKIKNTHRGFEEQTKDLSPDILKRELERFVIELSWKSSKIEGNTYTLLETETLIKEARQASGKTRAEAQMILNHKLAFEQILKIKKDFKILSLPLINQLHQILTKNLSVSFGIRMHAVGITGTIYQPLDNEHQIREAMERLVKVINANSSPLEKALIVSAMLPYIQPYTDGNKRTGRMLTNAILLAYDYYPLSYRSVDEDEFKKALIIFYEQGTIYHIKNLFIEQLIFSYNTYFK